MGASCSGTSCLGEKTGGTVGFQTREVVLRDEVAQGGFSTVWRGSDSDRNVYAAKQICCQEEAMVVAARREIEVHQAVKHPFVIELIDWAEAPSRVHPQATDVWLLLPFYSKGTVFDVVSKQPYSEVEALTMMESLCDAVASIHAAGYTHRDIKALNVLLSATQQPVLMDLGSCRPLVVEIRTRKDAMLEQERAEEQSTASYRAAELFDVPSECTIDGKVDVWSLGCLLYTLLFGHTPFESPVEGFMKLLAISGDVRFKSSSAEVSDETKAIITSCVHMAPSERLTLEAMAEAIQLQKTVLLQLAHAMGPS